MTEESREIVKRQISHPSRHQKKRGEREGDRRKKINGYIISHSAHQCVNIEKSVRF